VFQHRPGPMVQAPAFIQPHWNRGQQFLDPAGQPGVAGCRTTKGLRQVIREELVRSARG
jgi:hypothetical protein